MPCQWVRITLLCISVCVTVQAGVTGPALSAHDILNAAGRFSGAISPGEIIVLFPSNAGPDTLAGAQFDADGKLTTALGETRVLFDGVAAPMLYSVKGEASAIVPYAVANKTATEVVVEYQGVRSAPVTLPVVASVPALYTLNSSGKGQASILNETGCCNSARNPAARGAIAVLYATGEGETNPPGIDGTVSAYAKVTDYPVPKLPVEVTVGGEPAQIVYAGETPHFAKGLLQVNFRVPPKAPLGDEVPLVLTVGSARSPDGVTMAIRPALQQILLIEAEPAARNLLRKFLAGAGYDVFAAADDRQAFEYSTAHPIDLVISDLGAAADRRETLRRMQTQRTQLKIMVTALSPSPGTLRAADLLGAQALLTRPLTAPVVLQRVRELLRARPMPYDRVEASPLTRR